MKISTQTEIVFKRIGEIEGIKLFKKAGFDCLDFSISNTNIVKKYVENPSLLDEMLKTANEVGITFNQAHAPFPTSDADPVKNEEIFNSLIDAIKIASKLKIKAIVIHPVQHLTYKSFFYKIDNSEKLFKMNVEFYNKLIPYAKKYNVKIATENMWQWENAYWTFAHAPCSKSDEFIRYIDAINSEWLVGCLDIGHATLFCHLNNEDVPTFIKKMGRDRIKCLHMHDVDMTHDNHSLPGVYKINYVEIVKALKEIDYDGDFTLEADGFLTYFEDDFLPDAVEFMAKRIRYFANLFENL